MPAMTVVTPPAAEPVSTTQAKLHLRVDISADDTLIANLVQAAREHVEVFLRRALVTQTWEYVMDAFPAESWLALPRPPLQSVTSITYYDEDGNGTVFSSSNYLVDTDSQPGRIVLKTGYTWPSTTLQAANGVRIRYVAGYGDADDVPEFAVAALLLLLGDLYENRENTLVGQGFASAELPFAAKALMWPHRIL